jgi:hypothetical protein
MELGDIPCSVTISSQSELRVTAKVGRNVAVDKARHTANAVPKQSGLSAVRWMTAHIQEWRERPLRRSRE